MDLGAGENADFPGFLTGVLGKADFPRGSFVVILW
jgi:hypothetical protein